MKNNTTERNEMTKRISKLELYKKMKQTERKMYAAKMDWHLRKLVEAREAGNQFNVDWHNAEIAGCELRLHQLKKCV